MEKLDFAIAGAGIVILVVAIAGSALTGVAGGGSLYDLTFPLNAEPFSLPSKEIQGSGSADFTLEVAGVNVSHFEVKVAADSLAPHAVADAFKVTVEGPGGVTMTSEEPEFKVPVQDEPAKTQVRAPSQAEAATEGPAPSTVGVGTWTIRVDLTHGDPLPAPHTVTVSGDVERWSASAASPAASPK